MSSQLIGKDSGVKSFWTIRDYAYDFNRRILREVYGWNLDNWKKYPYSAFKARVYLELSAILVFLLQYTNIHPNHVTMVYACAGVIGAVLLSINSDPAVIVALVIFVLKGVLDWSDGVFARLTNRCSEEGAVLDTWGALVNSFCFRIGIGFYLFDRTQDATYIYLMVLIILLRAIDLRNFTYVQIMNNIIQRRVANAGGGVASYPKSMDPQIIGFNHPIWVARFKQLVTNILDDRARSVDFVCLVIFIEVFTGKLWVTPFIYWVYVAKYVLIFSGGVYLVYFKKMPTQVKDAVLGVLERDG